MKRLLGVTLGILTAIGGFVDIGDLVGNSLVGSRYGLSLTWATALGVIGIMLYAEMSGRIAAVAHRPVFDLVRERLGPWAGLGNLLASFLVTVLTLAAELGGVALALELVSSVNYLLWVPLVAFLVWIVIWRVKFESMERAFGLAGLFLIVFAVALWRFGPDWGNLLHQALHPAVPHGDGRPTYFYYAIALLGAAMTPYEVFFFSSGAVEERWTSKDLLLERVNTVIGFPLGGLLSVAIAGTAAVLFLPNGIDVDTLGQVALPVSVALGRLGLALAIVGIFAATFGAALETALSAGYAVSQYFGWQWGKFVKPQEASRFHAVTLISIVFGAMLILTTLDPVKVTEYSLVFSAVALPLTFVPVLVIANDSSYLGERVNGRLTNLLGTAILVILVVASIAAVPLMIVTKAGQ